MVVIADLHEYPYRLHLRATILHKKYVTRLAQCYTVIPADSCFVSVDECLWLKVKLTLTIYLILCHSTCPLPPPPSPHLISSPYLLPCCLPKLLSIL